MTMWHAETVAIVEQGPASGEFHSTELPADIAWAFYRPGVRPRRDLRPRHPDPDETAFSRYVNKMITLELF